MGDDRLDDLARALADGVPRRDALRMFGGLAAAVSFLSPAAALGALRKKCTGGRRVCGSKCCPKNFKCHTVTVRGKRVKKCYCPKPRRLCGKGCVDLKTNSANCGRCGHRCATGETCTGGVCVKPQTQPQTTPPETTPPQAACSTDADCASANIAGDCKKVVCASGVCTVVADDGDLPDDGNPCTQNVCSGGVASHPPVANGTGCNDGGKCSNGICSACASATDCGTNTECKSYACNSGTCAQTFTAAGTALAAQVAGDCRKVVCDGSGGTTNQIDDSDTPTAPACQTGTCAAGTPTFAPRTQGDPCAGGVCDGAGSCVECNVAADCPGVDTECGTRTCDNNHTCGSSFAALGTPVAGQTAGDCKRNVCDGSGGMTVQPDPSDIADDGNPCTNDLCSGGTPTHPAKPDGTPCPGGSCTAGVCG
jgi:hypothetical protein